MKTTKDILTENRESVISSIKFVCKVWKQDDVKLKMIDFLKFAQKNIDIEILSSSKKVKSDLKMWVQRMSIEQKQVSEKAKNIELYGTENPKLSDIMAVSNERYEDKGMKYNPIIKEWTK